MNGPERRQQPRVRANNLVTYVAIGRKRVTAAIENISASGVFLRASLGAPAGTRIGLEFFDGESKKTLTVTAIVRRVTEPGVGSPGVAVQFDELTFEQHRRMSSLIDSIEAARPEPTRAAQTKAPPPSAPKPDPRQAGAATAPGIKRRRNRRVPTRAAIAHVKMKGDVVALSVPVSNVSMGGLFLQTDGRLPVGADVDVELRLGGQSMVISGHIVGEVASKAGATPGLEPGLSMRFGPMVRRTADRLRQALAALAPLAADGLEQEFLPGGYAAEAPAPVAPAAAPPPGIHSPRRSDFDFGAGDLADHDSGELLQTEDLSSELERLRAEIKLREERIAMIEKTLREQ